MGTTGAWAPRLLTGALAGAVGGLASGALLLLATEPQIDQAIAIEEARTAGGDLAPTHGTEVAAHDHGELVTRLQQQIGGLVTVILVGVLFGLAFAVIYARTRHRLAGNSETMRSVSLAGLGFAAFALAPALLLPANPPAVGDPDTVNQRTVGYLSVIVLTIVLILAMFALDRVLRTRGAGVGPRLLVESTLVVLGAEAIFVLLPRVTTEIPADVPAALIWEFRLAALAQVAAMWFAMGIVHGVLSDRRAAPESLRSGQHPLASAS